MISGISGRFPNARNMHEFERKLYNKVSLIFYFNIKSVNYISAANCDKKINFNRNHALEFLIFLILIWK